MRPMARIISPILTAPPEQVVLEKLVLVTKEQLADQLSVSRSFVSKMMSEEGLPHIKIGRAVRFRVSEVMAWLQKRSRP
jgi:excisionase family DNA binding protein